MSLYVQDDIPNEIKRKIFKHIPLKIRILNNEWREEMDEMNSEVINDDKSITYLRYGLEHRNDGPSKVFKVSGNRVWRFNGLIMKMYLVNKYTESIFRVLRGWVSNSLKDYDWIIEYVMNMPWMDGYEDEWMRDKLKEISARGKNVNGEKN